MSDYTSSPPPTDPQVLHDRAGEAARETRSHVISLATGSLALFFIALTGKADPALTPMQQVAVMAAIVMHACAIASGLWSAFSDAQWSYNWAREIQAGDHPSAAAFSRKEREWHANKRWSEKATIACFAFGVALSAIYLALRVYT